MCVCVCVCGVWCGCVVCGVGVIENVKYYTPNVIINIRKQSKSTQYRALEI